MPLVRIDAPSLDTERLTAVGDAVHAALIAAFAIPPDDLFQILHGSGTGNVRYDAGYLGVQRDDGVVFVQVVLRRGRSDEQKRTFYAELATRAEATGVRSGNLVVVLTENGLADWSFGEGVAQYLENPPV